MFSWQHKFPVEATKKALALGLQILLKNGTDNVVSLKSRNVPLWIGLQTFMMPNNLHHLDLEMRVRQEPRRIQKSRKFFIFEIGSHIPAGSWRQHLQAMKQLKTLRLGLLPDAKFYTTYGGNASLFYVDDLLVNPSNPKDHCFFPRLERLELFDCACRLSGLLAFLQNHQQILKQLVLNRTMLPPDYSSSSWNGVAAMCREAAPGLSYLRLTKLRPNRSNDNRNNEVGVKPITKSWSSCLEDARTYEWAKGGMNGTCEEFIGLKCPWDCEGALKDHGKVCL